MRRLNFIKNTSRPRRAALGVLVLAAVISVTSGQRLEADAATEYYIGGMAAGFALPAGGAEIVELNSVVSDGETRRPAEEAGMRAGDLICAADGAAIDSIAGLNAALEKCGGRSIRFTVLRDGERLQFPVQPLRDAKTGKWKIGVLIRDTLSGIGTITYIEKGSLHFGALGHGIGEGASPDMTGAKVFACSVIGVNKGTRGRAGELKGLFHHETTIARAELFCGTGLFGTFESGYDLSACQTAEIAPVSEAVIGKAVIYSTVDGREPKPYEIAIAKVDANDRDNKNFVIKVTDEALIAETGGIVQGMSGSPILQNGKLIGAVTHVFLNDPTRGYGISIERMMTGERERR